MPYFCHRTYLKYHEKSNDIGSNASRLDTIVYPSGFVMQKHYTPTGHLDTLFNVTNHTVLWATESKNEFGQVTRYHTGDGVSTTREYDPFTGRLSSIISWIGNDTIQYLSYVFDKNANLASRKDSIRNMEERFIYDRLDRLTGIVEGNDTTGVFVYDAYGRMTMKRIHGATVFDNTAYGADGRPHALEQARVYAEQPEQRIRYTSFDKTHTIQQEGSLPFLDGYLRYDYGFEHQRIRMTEAVSLDSIVKEYVGNCEFVKMNGVTTSELTFLSGPLGVFAVIDSHVQPVGKGMYYVHPDHLGSWTTVTNRNGVVVQDVHFDPWGTPYYSDAVTPTVATSLLFDRGFTGHEHMTVFGLVNMNGRVYDPVTSTFLSVDNYVQDPSSTQNFNRYAYCMNNPLKYVDPDGEFFITFGLSFDKEHGLSGFSLGVNFGLFGFGVNANWSNGASLGVYAEVGPRIGNMGATSSVGIDFNFNYATTSFHMGVGIGLFSNTFKAGASASLSYTVKPNGNGYEGYGVNAGLGIGDDYGGVFAGVSYSNTNNKGKWSFGLAGYYDTPMVYNFNTHNNYQNKPDYCVPGTLEELSRSLGIDMPADAWTSHRQFINGHINVRQVNNYYQLVSDGSFAYVPPTSRKDIIEMINASGWAHAEHLSPDINNMVSAYKAGHRILAVTYYIHNNQTKGHVVPVSKLKIFSNSYRIYFSEVSPVSHVPNYISNVGGSPNQSFQFITFQLKP